MSSSGHKGDKIVKRKAPKSAFKPGHKKVGGIKKMPQDIKDALKSYAADAIRYLYATMKNGKVQNRDRIACARDLANRGFGLPKIDASVTGGNIVLMFPENLDGV